MNINKAIRDLKARVDGEFSIEGEDDCADMKLGIEALKRIKNYRAYKYLAHTTDLKGETEK